jgi:hypothetical protein
MYKLLALDLDGTLLRPDHTVEPRDIAAIAELQRAGVRVTIATGRLRSGSLGAARACNIEGTIACVEGSHLVDVESGESHVHHPIVAASATKLRTAFADLATFVFDKDAIHHDHDGAPFAHYVRTWSTDMRLVEEARAWDTLPLAAVAIGGRDEVAVAHAAVKSDDIFSVDFPVSQCPGKYAVLVRAKGPSKGTALAERCRGAGCTLEEAVVVGDWVNDVPMFQVAGRSFAMPSAPPNVRAYATDKLEAGGIAEAIRRAWG